MRDWADVGLVLQSDLSPTPRPRPRAGRRAPKNRDLCGQLLPAASAGWLVNPLDG